MEQLPVDSALIIATLVVINVSDEMEIISQTTDASGS